MRPADLRGRRVAVWGAGREGRAAVELLGHHGVADLVLVDDSPRAVGPEGVPVLSGAAGAAALAAAEVVVKSPGISRHRPDVVALQARGVEVTGGMALWLEAMAGAAVVGVTGTKGKSTTAALLHHLLEAFGRPAVLAGNIGVPVLSLLVPGRGASGPDDERPHIVEVSSYQAADVTASPPLGVVTSLHPEHLDWHGGVETYLADKLNLFAHGTGRVLVGPDTTIGAEHLRRLAATVERQPGPAVTDEGLVLGAGAVLRPEGWPLPGRHNLHNAALAIAAAEALGVAVTAEPERLHAALGSFAPLAHRLRSLGTTRGGLEFVDDTLSTVPQSTLAALAAFAGRPVTLVVGGHDRGVDLSGLAAALVAREEPTAAVCVPDTGAAVARMVDQLRGGPPDPGRGARLAEVDDLDDAVTWAVRHTPPGGVVLLSPAAPSYNRYRSHEELSARFAGLFERLR